MGMSVGNRLSGGIDRREELTCIEMTASSLLLLGLAAVIAVVTTVAHPPDLVSEAFTGHPEGSTGAAGRAFLVALDMTATAGPTGAQGVGSAGAGHSDRTGSEKQDSPGGWTEAC